MTSILDEMVTSKKQAVLKMKTEFPLSTFIDKINPSQRSFLAVLKQKQTSFILECKQASPSKGDICENYDIEQIAKIYNKHASAISVLCDTKYFKGDYKDLATVSEIVSCPILCKDFIIDPYQIYLARYYRANAILLMLSVLTDEHYLQLAKIATRFNLDILTETCNEIEMKRAIKLNANIIVINNRNLHNLNVDLNRTKLLAPLVSNNAVIISASGIYNHSQIKSLTHLVDGFLIGSSLMSANNLEQAIYSLTIGTNKVCGLTRAQDAIAAFKAGAIYGGLIFIPNSKRCICYKEAKAIRLAAKLEFVGVFKNQGLNEIVSLANKLNLAAIQLHGNESQAYINKLKTFLPKNTQIWKTIAIDVNDTYLSTYNIHGLINDMLNIKADKYILDSKINGICGGSGKRFNWKILNNLDNKQFILAGGINLQNVKVATKIGCAGLDINSGIEQDPGIKDSSKLQLLFAKLRQY